MSLQLAWAYFDKERSVTRDPYSDSSRRAVFCLNSINDFNIYQSLC